MSTFRLLLVCLVGCGLFYHCAPPGDGNCRLSQSCRNMGLCSAQDNQCVAATDADCKPSETCRLNGECTAQQGRCIATSDEDCRKSSQCQLSGRCLARKGLCVPITKGYCESQPACTQEGLCSLDLNRFQCAVQTNKDCERSELCTQNKQCLFEDGRCVITDQVCKNSQECKDSGTCSRKGNQCLAQSNEDCADSKVCRQEGKCVAWNGACVAPETPEPTQDEVGPEPQTQDATDGGRPSPDLAPEATPKDTGCYRLAPGEECAETCDPAKGVVAGSTCQVGSYCQFSSAYPPGYCQPLPRDQRKQGTKQKGEACSLQRATEFCDGDTGLICYLGKCATLCDPRQGVKSNPFCLNTEECLDNLLQSHLGGICQKPSALTLKKLGETCGGANEICPSTASCVARAGEQRCYQQCDLTQQSTCPSGFRCRRSAKNEDVCVPAVQTQGQSCDNFDEVCKTGLECYGPLGQKGQCNPSCKPSSPQICGSLLCKPLANGVGACVGGSRKLNDTCDLQNLCGTGLVCVYSREKNLSRCLPSCLKTGGTTCPSGLVCETESGQELGYCAQRTQALGDSCGTDPFTSRCITNLTCVRGVCRTSCALQTPTACQAGEECRFGGCITPTQTQGQVCDGQKFCVQGLACASDPQTSSASLSFCLKSCNSTTTCGTNETCSQLGNNNVCLPNPTQKSGETCNGLTQRCQQGLLCFASTGGAVCEPECDTRSSTSCLPGFGCQPVQGFQGVCRKGFRIIQEGEPCGSNLTACASGLSCQPLQGDKLCLKPCQSGTPGACASGSSCAKNSQGFGYCKAGTSQPLGAPCHPVLKPCSSNATCLPYGLEQAYCFQTCNPNQTNGCPNGMVCETLPGGSVCKPEGTRNEQELCVNQDVLGNFNALGDEGPNSSQALHCKKGLWCLKGRCRQVCPPGSSNACPAQRYKSCEAVRYGVAYCKGDLCTFGPNDNCNDQHVCISVDPSTAFCQAQPPEKSQREGQLCLDSGGLQCQDGLTCVSVQLDNRLRANILNLNFYFRLSFFGGSLVMDGGVGRCRRQCDARDALDGSVSNTTTTTTHLCPQDYQCSVGFCVPKQATTRKQEGESCQGGGSCTTGLQCVALTQPVGTVLPGSYCMKTCSQQSSCPTGYSCEMGGTSTPNQGVCVLYRPNAVVGSPCNGSLHCGANPGSTAPKMLCVPSTQGDMWCESACNPQQSSSCKANYKCEPWGTNTQRHYCKAIGTKKEEEPCQLGSGDCGLGSSCRLNNNGVGAQCKRLCGLSKTCAKTEQCRRANDAAQHFYCKEISDSKEHETCGQRFRTVCDTGFVCMSTNLCASDCSQSSCPSLSQCVNGVTEDGATLKKTCQTLGNEGLHETCTPGIPIVAGPSLLQCVNGLQCRANSSEYKAGSRCFLPCDTDADCTKLGSGFACYQKACRKLTSGLTEGQNCTNPLVRCGVGLQCMSAGSQKICVRVCDPKQTSPCPSGSSCIPSGTTGFCSQSKQPEFAPCNSVIACQSGLVCLSHDNQSSSPTYCFRQCNPNQASPCPSGSNCTAINSTITYCKPNAQQKEGEPCNKLSQLCSPGLECLDSVCRRPCLFGETCPSGLKCSQLDVVAMFGGTLSLPLVCPLPQKEGEFCNDSPFCSLFQLTCCDAGLRCVKSRCIKPQKKLGDICSPTAPCVAPLRCVEVGTSGVHRCQTALRRNGETCDGSNHCLGNLRCTRVSQQEYRCTQPCIPLLASVAFCEEDTQCATRQARSSQNVSAEVCVTIQEGTYCDNFNDCGVGFECDSQTNQCKPVAVSQRHRKEGDTCNTDSHCNTPFKCIAGQCSRLCINGLDNKQLINAGVAVSCKPGFQCVTLSIATMCRKETQEEGELCIPSVMLCKNGMRCISNRCVTSRIDEGKPCTSSLDCRSALGCLNGVCAYVGSTTDEGVENDGSFAKAQALGTNFPLMVRGSLYLDSQGSLTRGDQDTYSFTLPRDLKTGEELRIEFNDLGPGTAPDLQMVVYNSQQRMLVARTGFTGYPKVATFTTLKKGTYYVQLRRPGTMTFFDGNYKLNIGLKTLPTQGSSCDALTGCAGGLFCSTGQTCVSRLTAGTTCTSTEQCKHGLQCQQGKCAAGVIPTACQSDGDCSTGQVCEESQCVAWNEFKESNSVANDSFAQANPIPAPPSTTFGKLRSLLKDEDYYKFTLPVGLDLHETLTIELKKDNSKTSPLLLLELYDANQIQLNASSSPLRGLPRSIERKGLSAGTYYLRVTHQSKATYRNINNEFFGAQSSKSPLDELVSLYSILDTILENEYKITMKVCARSTCVHYKPQGHSCISSTQCQPSLKCTSNKCTP
ncbi:MAG: hypothetical protein EP343_07070 [Deltaproteobacteria bacterium]|nr:MAG: hypothetical protein EP343_07070 [Deltaproteobacteria bacterium]